MKTPIWPKQSPPWRTGFTPPRHAGFTPPWRTGFTLIELLLVVAILAIISSLGLAVIAGAENDALVARTEAQIERVSQVLDRRLEEYAYRILPIRIDSSTDPAETRQIRDAAVEELLRVEFPTRRNDLLDDPMGAVADPPRLEPPNMPPPGPYPSPFPVNADMTVMNPNPTSYDWTEFPAPQILFRYRARMNMPADGSGFGPDWTVENDGAECLWAILSLITLEDGQSGLTLIRPTDIRDTDGDGIPEIVDAFGDPLLVDLVSQDDLNDDGTYLDPLVDPHIDPRFDPLAMPDAILPTKINRYRLIIRSINTAGKI